MSVFYPVDAKFGLILRTRGLNISQLASKLDREPQVVLNALNGVLPIGSIATFSELDKIFYVTPGYFAGVYDNCRRSVEAERAKEVIDKQDKPDMITIPVDMLQSLYDIACEHGYPMFDVCEVLTKHKKDNT